MSSTKDGTMIILSSPSGAGKTTLVKLLAKTKKYQISISHTTRKPRENETSGKDYFFTNENEFKNLIKNNEDSITQNDKTTNGNLEENILKQINK